ncbi:hypothetical protein JNUCC1_02971 [Lentibacillus sp. JNUCC-1]|uniref:GNAT family N-acetyltransferase n=1 Tax=Lentibacillus sp. JNUCC-1 TaxID=2654513 RepID=UPI0012E7C1FB|nr:GNAT family N-acetyltransferase [Lentibacillus sp. JNUCC-1]MUV39099.1 hypothetical protein [Lentibacillus sp. JNUCC-1]
MNTTIEKAKDLKTLSLFLAQMNKEKTSHIGFCGEKPEEIHQTLKDDFIGDGGDVNFFVCRNDSGVILAAIGLDIDGMTAEVWGPFNQTSSVEKQNELWAHLLHANPAVETFQFFINKENTQQQLFMDEIKAEEKGEHLTLQITKKDFEDVGVMKSTPFVRSDFQAFEKIHNGIFPDTYYDAATIKDGLSNDHVLRLLKTESNEIQGYAYFEIDTEMGEASLEYIAIASEFQNKGLGTMLLKETLSEMFSYPQINEVTLTVENSNSLANHVYLKAGFKPKYVLKNYLLKR